MPYFLKDAPADISQDLRSVWRKRFIDQMRRNSVAIFVSNPECTRKGDTPFPFCQDPNVEHLSGFPEPGSVLILTNLSKQPSYQLLVQPKDKAQETWTGVREGVEGAKLHYAANEAYTIDNFNAVLGKLLAAAENVYYKFGHNPEFDRQFEELWLPRQKPLFNPENIVDEMRVIKSASELQIMRHASAISAAAHVKAMKFCRPGLYEFQLQSRLEEVLLYNRAVPAYTSIVGGGQNGVTLHYVRNSDLLRDGDLVLVDAAGEYRGYASDITRTYPVNGRFSKAQAEIYQLVLDAQKAGISVMRPGVPIAAVHEAACNVLNSGLIKLGILPEGSSLTSPAHSAFGTAQCSLSKAIKNSMLVACSDCQQALMQQHPQSDSPPPANLRSFFMHGTSHYIGRNTHDVGSYQTTDGTRTDKGKGKERLLEPGMVITVEPGLYFDQDDQRIPEQYRGIAVRIEHVVAVTDLGYEVLTLGVPTEISEIEHLMSR
jgi:Xaa-Pro aminopeptidase